MVSLLTSLDGGEYDLAAWTLSAISQEALAKTDRDILKFVSDMVVRGDSTELNSDVYPFRCRAIDWLQGATCVKSMSRSNSDSQLTAASTRSESVLEMSEDRAGQEVVSIKTHRYANRRYAKSDLSKNLQKWLSEIPIQIAPEKLREHTMPKGEMEESQLANETSTENSHKPIGVTSRQASEEMSKKYAGKKPARKNRKKKKGQQVSLDTALENYTPQQRSEALAELQVPRSNKGIQKEAKRLEAQGARSREDATNLTAQSSPLRNPWLKVHSGKLLKLTKVSHLSPQQLDSIFVKVREVAKFRWFAGRSILDFKIPGTASFELPPPYEVLDPLVSTMIAIAYNSLRHDEQLALLQLIVNFFTDGGNEVKPHRHRCRQICVSLGASRELNVEGRRLRMRHGDALPLGGEEHSVPPAKSVYDPRISVCLFYGSVEEYDSQSISVNAVDGWFGDSFWWCHPQDHAKGKAAGKGKSSTKGRSSGKGKSSGEGRAGAQALENGRNPQDTAKGKSGGKGKASRNWKAGFQAPENGHYAWGNGPGKHLQGRRPVRWISKKAVIEDSNSEARK